MRVALDGQLPLEDGEALDDVGVAMLADDACPDERCELGDRAALRIPVGELEDRGALPSDGILPDLPDLNRC
jgi:hypothetical protein